MSWRLLLFTLLVFAGLSTVGGLYAGDWLIKHAPVQANLPDITEADPPPPVDAQGRPLVRRPQQPLMNGNQGFPERETTIDWAVKAENLSAAKTASSTARLPSDMNTTGTGAAKPITNNVTRGSTAPSGNMRPIGQGGATTPSRGGSAGGSWETAFNRELAACRQMGFFERANCVANTRERYCGPNKAWGQVRDCPAR